MITKNLNKIIDYNFYPVKEAENSNKRHRPIGIGVQGLADVFAMLRMPFDSDEARDINRKFLKIYFAAIESSMEIARKRKKFVQEYKRIYNQQLKNTDYKFTDEETKRMQELENEHFITQEKLKLPGQYTGRIHHSLVHLFMMDNCNMICGVLNPLVIWQKNGLD